MEQQQLTIEGLAARVDALEQMLERIAAMMGDATRATEDGCRQASAQRGDIAQIQDAVEALGGRLGEVQTAFAERLERGGATFAEAINLLGENCMKLDARLKAIEGKRGAGLRPASDPALN